MLDELHDLRAAAAAIRRLDRAALQKKDAEAIDRLLQTIDQHGEAMARAVRIEHATSRAIEAAKSGNEAEQIFGTRRAIVSLVQLARQTGLSQLAKYEAVTRATDQLGIEPLDPFTHKPGSPGDKDENIGLHETAGDQQSEREATRFCGRLHGESECDKGREGGRLLQENGRADWRAALEET